MNTAVRTALLAAAGVLLAALPAAGTPAAAAAPLPDEERTTVGIQTSTRTTPDDRGWFVYTAPPRGVIRDYVAVQNYSLHPVTVRLLPRDAASTQEAPFAVQDSAARPTELGAWIGLAATRLRIPARSMRIVPFQLGVPHDAAPGDHAGAIVLSLLAKKSGPKQGEVVVDHRVGLRIYLRVPGELTPSLAVSDLQAGWDGTLSPLGRGTATVSYTVRNSGNVRLGAAQAVQLAGPAGLSAHTAVPPAIDEILPGGEIRVTQTFPGVLGAGPMHARVTLTPAPVEGGATEGAAPVTASVDFAAWPSVLVVALLLLAVLLPFGGWNLWRRRRRPKLLAVGGTTERPRDPSDVLVRSIGMAAAVAVLAAAISLGSPAHAAAEEWRADTSTKEGTSGLAFDILTTGGCPPPATSIIGWVRGRGFPAEGAIAISTTSAEVRSDGPFRAYLVDTMAGLMQMQESPQALGGVYEFTVSCIDAEHYQRSYGDYVVNIEFTTPETWHVLPPLTRQTGPVAGDDAPAPGSTDEPGGAGDGKGTGSGDGAGSGAAGAPDGTDDTDGTDGTDGAGDTAGAGGDASGSLTPEQQAAARAAELNGELDAPPAASDSSISWPLMAAGLALLAGVVLLLLWPRLPFGKTTH